MKTLAPDRRNFEMFTLPEGTHVVSGNDHYVVGSEIGRGGFGVIYAANLAGHHFALKIAVGDLAVKKLANEVKITAALSRFNAGVLPIRVMTAPEIRVGGKRVSFGGSDFSVGIIRDMRESGMFLADILQEKDTDLIRVIDLMLALIRVLEPIHEREGLGYIHGDLSPENIIVLPSRETVLLIDFGNAQCMDENGFAEIEREEITYNPIFMAPELRTFVKQTRSSIRLTKASDIYSLGMIFYALLFETPDLETCEHIAVLARNRVQTYFGAGFQGKTLARLLRNLFDECLAVDEQDRIGDTIRLKERLSEIRDVASGFAVTKAGLQAQIEERHVFPKEYGMRKEHHATIFQKLLQNDGAPLFVSGVRDSGKTSMLKSLCADLLERGHTIPLFVSAGELPDTNDTDILLRGIAQTVFHRLFGGFGLLRAEKDAVSALVHLIGFNSDFNEANESQIFTADERETHKDDASVSGVEYLLVVDDMHILARRTHSLDAFAKALPGISKTRFVFCGKAPPEHYENADFTALFAEENIFRLENPMWVAASNDVLNEAPDDEIFRALDLLYRVDIVENYPFLPALAYALRGASSSEYLPIRTVPEYSLRRAVWDGILEEIPYSAPESESDSESDSEKPLPLPLRFSTSLLADFFAAFYVAGAITQSDKPETLLAVNHVWRRGLVRMLRALPSDLFDALVRSADALLADLSDFAGNKPDMMPANLFALTGDTKWARLSLKAADRFFHEEILDGYFVYENTILLCTEFGKNRGDAVTLDFSGEDVPKAVLKLPERIRIAVSADLKYGYRLDQNPLLANALTESAQDSGRKRMFGGGGYRR